MAETNIKVLKIEVDTGTGVLKVNGVTKSIEEATAATKEFAASASKMKKSTVDLGSSAGIAGATVNEFGRLISDMPFGITAVTNNISQLGSMFTILVQKTGSVSLAFKSLIQTLRASPALVALLAFQAAVAGLELWAQNSRKATKATADLNKSVGEAATELKIARDILNDSTASLDQKKSVLSQVNKEYKDFKLVLDETGIATAESTSKLNEQIAALERMAKSQAIVNQVQTLYGEIAILTAKTGAEVATFWDQLAARSRATSLFPALFGFGGNTKEAIEEEGNKTKEQLIGKTQETIDALLKQLEVLFKENPTKGPAKKSLEDFNLMLIKSQIEYLNSVNAITEESEIRRIEGINGLKLEELKILEDTAIEKAKKEKRSNSDLLLIQESYQNKRVALMNSGNKDILDAMKSFNTKLELDTQDYADDKHLDAMLETLLPTKVQLENRVKDVVKGLAAYQKKREETEANGNEAVAKLRYEDMLAAVYAAQDLSNGVFAVIDASFQREIDIEQDKTNKVNNELKERLANEQLSADERKKIQNQIARNDEDLRKKQEKIEEKKFKLNKAASIANATVNTFLAATDALKQPGSTFQKIASMVAIIGAGLAQVAVIAKQKFVSSQSGLSGSGAGGAGGGGGVQAPDFNIVGQSPSNQLAAAVKGQFQQPVKAYVVSKDVSTAQEMDRNIVGAASLG